MHQSRVRRCPPSFPNDFYWYGGKRSKAGRPPKRLLKQLEAIEARLKQPGITNNSLVPEETTTHVDQRDAEPTEYQMTTKGDPKKTQPKHPHRYAL